MLEGWEKVAKVLDQNRPGWHLEWACQNDLIALARGEIRVEVIKTRVVFELFHPIIHAALEAGIVLEKK